ncbi:2-methylcitrate dehydratase, mitochondrial [Neolecta irregularis DAH-3]|uniref:2-methylcitrate dehydratase, mitochondrial n=1 Tax=Neolecta irregularis (strain DAH-3) TaxID=1198029 RepID=A0A1U7LM70_NEOID|nr:2-methylcitrate dehydratase, mitochondrial [Neolecta irregularis DAH-3]|eukprot:OLL23739.1 2-methylcitrate dehydratase, mitochondrial [Neolecta irregularis DAH-3]
MPRFVSNSVSACLFILWYLFAYDVTYITFLLKASGVFVLSTTAKMVTHKLFRSSIRTMSSYTKFNIRPKPDKVLTDIAAYVHSPLFIPSQLAYDTAHLCLLDSLGCGLASLKFSECTKLLGHFVPGTIVPNGTKVPGTGDQMDPVRGAWNIGTMIRWLDFNDCWLAAEWGHPSDNLGGILAVADWLSRTNKGSVGPSFTIKDVLTAMIQAHEIQGCLALENSFNRVGLDHVVLVKVASTAVVSKMLGLSESQTTDAISQAFVDGQSLRTYRHAPNTGSRKSWAAGDATARAVQLALMVQKGEIGLPSVLTAPTWGFYDVLFNKQPFQFQRDYGDYVMSNILFKISYPAEFHAQTAVEAAHKVYASLGMLGKSAAEIIHVEIKTQNAAIRIIDKTGPLHNYADRDHCIQYMVAIPLLHGRLTAEDYSDAVASDPRVDELREKMVCVEEQRYSIDYLNPELRSIGNKLTVTLNDGTVIEEEVEYPVGHRLRRDEGKPLLWNKFERHLKAWGGKNFEKIIETSRKREELEGLDVDTWVDLWCEK